MLLQKLRERELTAGWRGELKLYTLHHTNSNTLEHHPSTSSFTLFLLSLMTHEMHNRGFVEMNKTKMQVRVGTRYTGAKTTVKTDYKLGIFLKRKERVVLEQ